MSKCGNDTIQPSETVKVSTPPAQIQRVRPFPPIISSWLPPKRIEGPQWEAAWEAAKARKRLFVDLTEDDRVPLPW